MKIKFRELGIRVVYKVERVDEIMKIIDICAADVIIKDALLMPTVRLYHPVVK